MEAAIDPPSSRRRRRKQRRDIQELPSHIICDILSRLPLKSIFNCRRSFRNLTLEPYFAQLQLPRSPLCFILYRPSYSGRPTYFGFVPLHDSLVGVRRRRATMMFKTLIEIHGRPLSVVNSCNGLICLSDYKSSNNVYVCNPPTRQHFRLPESEDKTSLVNEQRFLCWCGIGYSRSANLFKVVKFTENLEKLPFERQCSIYTLGVDDEWRTLGDARVPYPQKRFVFFNVAFHWLDQENSMLLLGYFDIEKEQCGNLPLPSQFPAYGCRLGIVDNCLYIIDEGTYSVAFKIWVMKEYRNNESWTLEWIIRRSLPSGLYGVLNPVKTLEDGTVLMRVGMTTLASYNPVSTVLKKISYDGVTLWEQSIAGVLSFLPLPGL